jgi:hypothetical protein
MVEHLTVAQDVAGSSPVSHPVDRLTCRCFTTRNSSRFLREEWAPVAQMDRASDFESAGRVFESPRAC